MALEYPRLFGNPRDREGRCDRGVGNSEFLESFGGMTRGCCEEDKEASPDKDHFAYRGGKGFHSFFLLSARWLLTGYR